MPSDHLASGTLKLIVNARGVHGRTRTLEGVRSGGLADRDGLNRPGGSGSGLGLEQRGPGRSAWRRSLDDPGRGLDSLANTPCLLRHQRCRLFQNSLDRCLDDLSIDFPVPAGGHLFAEGGLCF